MASIETTTGLAFAALVWSGWQEIRLWKLCNTCPYKRYVEAKEEEKKVSVQQP